jgi:hypothetical protein
MPDAENGITAAPIAARVHTDDAAELANVSGEYGIAASLRHGNHAATALSRAAIRAFCQSAISDASQRTARSSFGFTGFGNLPESIIS